MIESAETTNIENITKSMKHDHAYSKHFSDVNEETKIEDKHNYNIGSQKEVYLSAFSDIYICVFEVEFNIYTWMSNLLFPKWVTFCSILASVMIHMSINAVHWKCGRLKARAVVGMKISITWV